MEGRRLAGPVWLTGAAVCVGLVVTVVVLLVPDLHFAYRSEPTHLVLETADASIAALVALLLYGRFLRSRSASDLLVSHAMTLLAVASLGFATIPLLSGADHRDAITTWAPLALRVLAAATFAAAALTPARQTVTQRRAVAQAGLGVAVIAVIATVALLAPHAFPVPLDQTLTPGKSSTPHFSGHPGVLTGQALDLFFYSVACAAFTWRARLTHDKLTAWLGAGAGLSATARVNYMLFPSLFSQYVYVGDFLRTGFYLMLLVGATREIRQYWGAVADAAILDERQRVARDLHDGLTQELTYIWSQLQQLERHPDQREILPRLTSASARAIDEARRAIAALTMPIDAPLSRTLAQAAEEVAGRYDAKVALDIEEVDLDTERRESLIRIVREAVSNSARYAGAGHVVVRLQTLDGQVRLAVSDAGAGFDAATIGSRGGFGLTTMRQRVERSGGRFELTSAPGMGTVVTAVWDV